MRATGSLILVTALSLCFVLMALPVFAWEFQLAGAFNWTYQWYNQRGTQGFFGPYNVDNGAGTRTANLNFWNGGQFDTNITTSADAGWSWFNVEFLPQIKVNEALRFQGKYRIGLYGQPQTPNYITQNAPGLNNAFSEGQWTLFWATVNTPVGVVAIGKRRWAFGTGLQYDGAGMATTESLLLAAPYGPLDIGIGFYPYRFAGSSTIGYGDPYNLPTYVTGLGFFVPGQYFSVADRSGSFSKDVLAFVNYFSGPVNAGVVAAYGSYHIGPEAVLVDSSDPLASPPPWALDSNLFHGCAYVKYNNGRLFFNAEAAWLYWTDRYLLTTPVPIPPPFGLVAPFGLPLSNSAAMYGLPNNRYVEQWKYMVETGLVAGPVKVSLLSAYAPGPDRRAGGFIDRQAAAFVRHDVFDRHLASFSVIRPYGYILGSDYGFGLNAYNLAGDQGFLRDAFVLGARMDYAVAANLNVYGSFFWARRTSDGYSWGCLGPNEAGFNDVIINGNVDFTNLNRYPASPNIPDRELGYEIDCGADWKLLEGWTATIVLGYWQPGKWFSYACIDRSVPGWNAGTAGNNFGTRPGRTIDPVIGGEFSMQLTF
ncbi:MAG: hypothetical protein HY913_19015 [Desulfomonile tiedjei]|nr:hypothetical protein [Desulfomonile tiedjei]